MDPLEKARKVIAIEMDGLTRLSELLGESFSQAIAILLEAMGSHRKIVVIGVGKSGNIGHKIAATFNSTGSTAVVLNSQNALHGDLGILSDGDAVLALSYSGETPALIDLLPFLKKSAVRIIALTGRPDSTLGQHSDLILDTSVKQEACPLKLAPTASSTNMLVMGDALAMVLLEARGFTEDDFARFHPGGALGRALLTRVSDIMRSGEHLATVQPDQAVQDALAAMSQARSGACLVLAPTGELLGIFTHGDFARAFQEDATIGSSPVADFMTADPIRLQADSLAAEAIKAIGEKRIDDLVVVDSSGQPVGLIDSQDLARLKLV
jgi:arabinose-5-phosphate isomerase